MELTGKMVKDFGKSRGLDLVGVANIERFAECPERMHPASIFPECRSVIVVARRIVRGGWRGIEEGTHWPSYTYFDYHGLLNSFFLQMPVYELACFVEDHGWEAAPYYPGGPEKQPAGTPLRQGGVAPEVELSIRLAGVAAGLGEMGWAKVFMSRELGPRQRLAAIFTDANLEPDPLVEPGSICTRCMKCVEGCPSKAIPHIKDKKVVRVRIEDKVYEWGDVHMGKCALSYHGGDPTVSPFMAPALPGFALDARAQDISQETAYKFAWTMSTGAWRKSTQAPEGHLIPGHAFLQQTNDGGSYGIGGSRGCMRSCFNVLEEKGIAGIKQKNGPFIKRDRWILSEQGLPQEANIAQETDRGCSTGMPMHTLSEETKRRIARRSESDVS